MISIVALTAASIALLALILSLFYAISVNIRQGEAVRRALVERLTQLRLHRILGLFNIDLGTFIHSQPLTDVERQMRTCAACKATDECDSALEKGTSDLGFCGNREDLAGLRSRPH